MNHSSNIRHRRPMAAILRSAALFAAGLAAIGLAAPEHAWSQEPLPGPRRNDKLANPTDEVRQKVANLIGQVIEPELILHVDPTSSKLMRTKQPVSRMAITDPNVLEVNQYSPTEFEVIGKKSGETTLTLWFAAPGGGETVLRYLVRIASSQGEQKRAELEYGDLQSRLNELFPNSQVQLFPVADKLIVRGQARDAEEATQIMSILRSNAASIGGGAGGATASNPLGAAAAAGIPGAADLPQATVVSLLRVPGEQQVMLKVRIAEMTRTALRELGVEFSVVKDGFSFSNLFGTAGNITAILDGNDINLFIRAFSNNGNGKILAEPTLVTLSGKTATFIAGGEFAVPTTVGVDGVGAATTTFRGFGTQLAFTPTVLDKDKIRLNVSPSFSTLNQDNTVNGIPGLDTRAVSTTVNLREGQWLAIAGLIQDEQGGNRGRIPYLGDIPVVGTLFGTQNMSRDETELVVLVSPELVHPLEHQQVPLLLPGMDVTEPTDHAFFWKQQIEGDPGVHHRSTVWPAYKRQLRKAHKDAKKAKRGVSKRHSQFQQCQEYYINGSHGFSD